MPLQMFRIFGGIAGLAGLGLAVYLAVDLQVLSLRIMPEGGLTGDQAYKIIISLVLLTFGLAVIGIVSWLKAKFYVILSILFSVIAVVCAVLLSSSIPIPAKANKINIASAYMQALDGSRRSCGLRSSVILNCDGAESCQFSCSWQASDCHRDFADGVHKECIVNHTCSKLPKQLIPSVFPEDDRNPQRLSCPND